MKHSDENHQANERAKAKAEARSQDRARMIGGIDRRRLQSENSALSDSFFKRIEIRNLSDAIGR